MKNFYLFILLFVIVQPTFAESKIAIQKDNELIQYIENLSEDYNYFTHLTDTSSMLKQIGKVSRIAKKNPDALGFKDNKGRTPYMLAFEFGLAAVGVAIEKNTSEKQSQIVDDYGLSAADLIALVKPISQYVCNPFTPEHYSFYLKTKEEKQVIKHIKVYEDMLEKMANDYALIAKELLHDLRKLERAPVHPKKLVKYWLEQCPYSHKKVKNELLSLAKQGNISLIQEYIIQQSKHIIKNGNLDAVSEFKKDFREAARAEDKKMDSIITIGKLKFINRHEPESGIYLYDIPAELSNLKVELGNRKILLSKEYKITYIQHIKTNNLEDLKKAKNFILDKFPLKYSITVRVGSSGDYKFTNFDIPLL